MATLGRMRALGAIGNVFYQVLLMEGMDPKAWAASDPALKLNMTLVSWVNAPLSIDGKPAGGTKYIFTCPADPATASMLLRQDPRVVELVLLGAESEGPLHVQDTSHYVEEARPAPGQPQIQNAGYVPKLPSDPTKSLSINDVTLAAMPTTAPVPVVESAVAGAKKIPWWGWLLGLYALSRR